MSIYLNRNNQQHNLEVDRVTNHGDVMPHYESLKEMKQTLEAEQTKLVEIEGLLKSKLDSLPNTFMGFDYNPAIWTEIISQRDEYLKCAVASQEPVIIERRIKMWKSFIEEAKNEVETSTHSNYKQDTNDMLRLALSQSARQEWLKERGLDDLKANLDPLFDGLAAAAAKKVGQNKPSDSLFAFRDARAEQVILKRVKDSSTIKIFQIGFDGSGWRIQRDNYDLLIRYRYKDGYAYLRDTADTHPYCKLVWVRVGQNYNGGGTYSTQYFNLTPTESLVGCPAGVK